MIAPPGAPVLLPGCERDEFFAICRERGWPLASFLLDDPSRDVSQTLIFAGPEEGDEIHWVNDLVTSASYVSLAGPRADELADLVGGLIGAFSPELTYEMWRTAAKDIDAARCVFYVGLISPPRCVDAHLAELTAAVTDARSLVREAALVAIDQRRWPEARGLVERAANDEHPDVRARAQRLLAAYEGS